MTQLLEQAIEAARQLTAEEQDELARSILAFATRAGSEPVRLTERDKAAIARAREAAAQGRFATEQDVRAVWAKHGL